MKKLLSSIMLAMLSIGSTFAIIQPNIVGLTGSTNVSGSTNYVMIQSGTVQRKILMTDFASSLSLAPSTWLLSGTSAYYTAGNVGIGTNNPTSPLTVVGNTYLSGTLGVGTAPTATKLTVGTTADGTVATFNGGANGAGVIELNRNQGGTVQAYSLGLASGKLVFRDTTNSQNIFYASYALSVGIGTLATLNIGGYEPGNSTNGNTALLKSMGAGTAGTNTYGGNLYLAPGAGRGDGPQSEIRFFTPDKVGSGTNEQNQTVKMTIRGDGNIGIGSGMNTPTLLVQIGSISAGYVGFTTGGFMQFFGSGIVRNDIQNLQLWDTDSAGDKPSLSTISGSTIKTRCFDGGGSARMMYGSVEIPHDFYSGTGAVLSPHIHWLGTTTSATTTGIRFIDYTIMKVNGTYSNTITITGTVYGVNAWEQKITEIDGDIPATGLALGDTVSFRVWRDSGIGTDTYAGNMCLTQVGFHYQIDRLGSRTEFAN